MILVICVGPYGTRGRLEHMNKVCIVEETEASDLPLTWSKGEQGVKKEFQTLRVQSTIT